MYICFIDYTKAFDRILMEFMQSLKKANIPEPETRLIANLYWNQNILRTRSGDAEKKSDRDAFYHQYFLTYTVNFQFQGH